MTCDFTSKVPVPIVDQKEAVRLDALTERYHKLIEPGKIAEIGAKIWTLIPEKLKEWGSDVGSSLSEQKLYMQIMQIIETGFQAIEEQAARLTISEEQIVKKVNRYSKECQVTCLDEICFARSYDLAKAVNQYRSQDTFAAAVEGGGTGVFGFWGLPFNIVLSTFLYFRAVQSIAMFYGYDVKNDQAELVIASEVFCNALNPVTDDVNNEATGIIGKLMIMSQTEALKQTAKKGWTAMASHGGIPLLVTQMRAMANKAAEKALHNAGRKGLEKNLFSGVFEQLGRKLTLKSVGKAVPVVSGVLGALIDTAQMAKVLEFADIFYQKRFILEKEMRIYELLGSDVVATVEIEDEPLD